MNLQHLRPVSYLMEIIMIKLITLLLLLGLVLANPFMGYDEKICLDRFKSCQVILYRRDIDDIIDLFFL